MAMSPNAARQFQVQWRQDTRGLQSTSIERRCVPHSAATASVIASDRPARMRTIQRRLRSVGQKSAGDEKRCAIGEHDQRRIE